MCDEAASLKSCMLEAKRKPWGNVLQKPTCISLPLPPEPTSPAHSTINWSLAHPTDEVSTFLIQSPLSTATS